MIESKSVRVKCEKREVSRRRGERIKNEDYVFADFDGRNVLDGFCLAV